VAVLDKKEKMSSVKLGQAAIAFEDLKVEFNKRNSNNEECRKLLSKMKLLLADLNLLSPVQQIMEPRERLLAREFLEFGALWSIRVQDIPSFERYMTQLKSHYTDFSEELPVSQRMYMLLGLNLLRLLAQNRIAEFHTELELIDPKQLHENMYIKHPVEIEQCLMEGSYNKVVRNRASVPANEFLFFIDILLETIRNEIAKCIETSYDSLPIVSAAKLLFFDSEDKILSFAEQRNWDVNIDTKTINFQKNAAQLGREDITSLKTITNTLFYARELEKIV